MALACRSAGKGSGFTAEVISQREGKRGKHMKKLLLALMAALMLFGMAACSSTCKESGCNEEVYKKGYCAFHYGYHYPEEALKDAFGSLF